MILKIQTLDKYKSATTKSLFWLLLNLFNNYFLGLFHLWQLFRFIFLLFSLQLVNSHIEIFSLFIQVQFNNPVHQFGVSDSLSDIGLLADRPSIFFQRKFNIQITYFFHLQQVFCYIDHFCFPLNL